MPIALLTDFGTSDYYVGAMKGVILAIDPRATIVDITHEIRPQDIREAAFILAASYQDFPSDTIFLCVVDPGVGSDRRAIAADIDGRKFVCPDNGLLGLLKATPRSVHQLTEPRFRRSMVSNTFHGRDIFAPAAAYLSLGTPISELGPAITDLVRLSWPDPIGSKTEATGEIIHIDHFGNLVTNLTPWDIKAGSAFRLNGVLIDRLLDNYSQALDDQPFAIVGSAGFIEISVNGGSAADRLRARVGDVITASQAARPGET